MIELQKIEELKQDIEKSKMLRDYLKREVDELEDQLKNCENENKQTQMEYELKKNELEEKLNSLKEEVRNEESLGNEERKKYEKVENELKERINYISLQNSNILDKSNAGGNKDNMGQNSEGYNFKQVGGSDTGNNENDDKLKNQILYLLKKINESGQ
jgi:chromosome segregation ATPase